VQSGSDRPSLDAALRHLAEQERQALTSHPTPQALAAYHAGELPPEEEARILDHLSICRECSDLLLDLSGFADLKPPEGVPELTDQQIEQDWQKLRSKMREEEEGGRKPAEVVPIRPAGPVPKPERTFWLPIAASLLAVLGFSFGLYQSMQLSKHSRLRVVPAVSSEDLERGPANPQISAREGGSIVLTPGFDKDYSEYEADLVRIEGEKEEVLTSIQVGDLKEGDAFLVPPLAPGTYDLRLYGIEGGGRMLSSNLLFDAR